jgi:inosine triphosphate pyrophosphatase
MIKLWHRQVHCEAFDLEEPQANAIEISIAKCKQAVLRCNGPVIVEDTSLCFNALGGLPGPYIKWFFESLGSRGLAKLLDGFDDKSAYAQCVLSFTLGKDCDIKTFVGSTDGVIVNPTGPQGFGWDPVFKVS